MDNYNNGPMNNNGYSNEPMNNNGYNNYNEPQNNYNNYNNNYNQPNNMNNNYNNGGNYNPNNYNNNNNGGNYNQNNYNQANNNFRPNNYNPHNTGNYNPNNNFGGANFDAQGALKITNLVSWAFGLIGVFVMHSAHKDKTGQNREFDESYYNILNFYTTMTVINVILTVAGEFIPFVSLASLGLGIYLLCTVISNHKVINNGQRIEKNSLSYEFFKPKF